MERVNTKYLQDVLDGVPEKHKDDHTFKTLLGELYTLDNPKINPDRPCSGHTKGGRLKHVDSNYCYQSKYLKFITSYKDKEIIPTLYTFTNIRDFKKFIKCNRKLTYALGLKYYAYVFEEGPTIGYFRNKIQYWVQTHISEKNFRYLFKLDDYKLPKLSKLKFSNFSNQSSYG